MINNNYDNELLNDIQVALINDVQFNFKKSNSMLRHGVCPNCNEREAFINLEKPHVIKCGRLNNCGWSATVREIFPDIFENLSARYKATETNPNATADAFMSKIRGFDLAKISGMYTQANVKHKNKSEYYPAVKIIISKSCYWTRVIDAADVRKNGAKSKIIGNYKGFGWYPENMQFNEGDEIWITEGIFKSMAFMHVGMKSISGLSAHNLPIEIIKQHKNKNITWIVAQDNDKAGCDFSKKFKKYIEDIGERVVVAFPAVGEDWDDVYRAGNLNSQYLSDSYFRGFYHMAETYQKKAFFAYHKYKNTYSIIDFRNALYRFKVDPKKLAEANEATTMIKQYPCPERGWLLPQCEIDTLYANFNSESEIRKICPCKPQFLYIEKDIITNERTNTFFVEFANQTPSMLLTADGTIYKSADNFSQGLLKHTGFAPFVGNNVDLAILHERWFARKIKFVQGVPFTGYEPKTQIYVFPEFAYNNGQYQKINKHGFFSYGRTSVKCNLKGFHFRKADEFNGDWINDYYDAFHYNGMVLLAWWLGTLFAEQIRKKQDSWPFLEYTGEPGAGKSTQLRFMWRCLGIEGYEGFDPNKTTMAGRSRQMTQGSNLPVVLLEADRHDGGRKSMRGFDFSELKNLYNGGVIRTTGVKTGGSEVKTSEFRGGIVISQNAEVDGEMAVLERIVHCHCTKEHFNENNAQKACNLRDMNGTDLGGFLHQALRNERQLLHGYFREYERIYKKYENSVPNWRIVHNHAQITAWLYQLPKIFGNRLSAEQLQKVEDFIWSRANSRLERVSGEHPAVQQFWEVYDYLNVRMVDNTRHYCLDHSRDEKVIAINMPNFQQIAADARQNIASTAELLPLLKNNKTHKCQGVKVITSALLNKQVKCWIFANNNSDE